VRALADVSFTVDPGSSSASWARLGRGRPRSFGIIAGLEEATEGTVSLDGEPIEGPDADLGIVFQEYHLFPWRTVAGNVGFGPEKRGVPADERDRRVGDLPDLVGLDGFADSYPRISPAG